MTRHEFIELNANDNARHQEPVRGGKLLAALLSWWRYRVRPPIVPQHLRRDLGLPPESDPFADRIGVPPLKVAPVLIALWRQ